MPSGFLFNIGGGSVQIQNDYLNMVLVAKGVAAFPSGGGPAEVAVTGRAPFVMINGGFPVSIGLASRSGNQVTFKFYCSSDYRGQSFTYYVFDWPSVIGSGANRGVQVFRGADSQLAFDSNQKWLKVMAIVNCGSADSSGSYAALPAGRTYAVGVCQPGFRGTFTKLGGDDAQGNATWIADTYNLAVKPLSNGMAWAPCKYYDNYQFKAQAVPPPTWSQEINPGIAMVADVTNY
ncbi:hypothetical protein NG829_08525 [Xanthomonas sacchari]|uniref:hypothetical protein n=1 Tax=Xanthomonas sacchari TaxID=56458 RepID=UPI00225E3767|nr:hypothetical protein [Xanthomonas sacchari]UYK82321.1 hypothetical protein NG829_08525 [Xanthomonas sacchari]